VKEKARWIVPVAVLAALTAAGYFLPLGRWVEALLERLRGLGGSAPLLYAAAYAAGTVLFLPGAALTLGAGLAFGFWVGLAVAFAGGLAGALAAFALARTVLRERLAKRAGGRGKLARLERAIERDGLKIVVLLRLAPVLPFTGLNYALGATRVSWRDYALGTAVGIVPGAAAYTFAGTGLSTLVGEGAAPHPALLWGGIAASIAASVALGFVARRALRSAAG
jgi:uncharacterized membrane protein YdjX (TVP38/TMEM64 family)